MSEPKQPIKSPKVSILYGVIVVLVLLCAALAIRAFRTTKVAAKSPSISLGAMQFRFSGESVSKRTDASVTNLQAFLENDAKHEGCPADAPAYEHVTAYNLDETQVFIKYGCGAADSPIYAVKTLGAWKLLSPTNHFDPFQIPDCAYVTSNAISTQIAPVCVTQGQPNGPEYTVR